MSKKSHKALASATVMSLILTSTLTATVSAATGVERLSGSNRETTAIDVATKVFEKSETVVLVNGYKSADALSATPLAKAYNAPILSVGAVDEPSAALLTSLKDLGAKKVIVVGGEGAVTKALATKLAETYTVERIEGKDRYATNVNVAKKVMELKASKEAFVVNGSDASYADALSIASIAASKGAPIVFTNGKTVSEEAKALVKDLKVAAIGGTGVVSAEVLEAVNATRVGGADRFATNLEVLKAYKDVIKLDNVFVAYGLNFADALVASAAAAKTDAPVVLADKTNTAFTKGATNYIEANKDAIKNVYLVGGTGVISDSVKNTIDGIVNPVVVNKDLAVESVNAINAKQLEIKFNKAVDEDSVVTSDDKLVAGLMIINRLPAVAGNKTVVANDLIASLSDDGKVLKLTAADATYFDGSYALSIVADEILSEDRTESISGYTTSFSMDDTTAPTVKSITYKPATSKLEIKMSEPVLVKPSVKVDGSATIATVKDADINDTFTVDVDSDLAGETIEVVVSGTQDYMRNLMTSYTKSIKLSVETGDVVIDTITQKNSNTASIKFNRAIAGTTASEAEEAVKEALTVMHGTNKIDADDIEVTRDADDSTLFHVAITQGTGPDWFYGKDKSTATLAFSFDEGALEDVYGNTNEEDISKTVKMAKDTAGPKILSSRVANSEKEIRVRFDQELAVVARTAAENKGVELRKSGVVVENVEVRVAADSDELVLTRVGGTAFANGDYSIRFTKGTDNFLADVSGNKVSTQTYSTITVDDGDASLVDVVENGIDTVAKNTFTVEFDGKVGLSALTPANYSLNGTVLPDNTDIIFIATADEEYSASDRRAVKITLQSNTINYSDAEAVLTVVGVKDADGNKVKIASGEVVADDNVAAKLKSARLVGNTMILKFDENISDYATTDLNTVVNDFIIKRGTVALTIDAGDDTDAVVTSVNKDTLTITVTEAGTSNWATIVRSGGTITIETAEEIELTDANDVTVDDGVKVTFSRN